MCVRFGEGEETFVCNSNWSTMHQVSTPQTDEAFNDENCIQMLTFVNNLSLWWCSLFQIHLVCSQSGWCHTNCAESLLSGMGAVLGPAPFSPYTKISANISWGQALFNVLNQLTVHGACWSDDSVAWRKAQSTKIPWCRLCIATMIRSKNLERFMYLLTNLLSLS